jgi:tetratricopeptide (TPR) repeat protein
MFARLKNFFRRLFQPISSSQYFVGVRLFNSGKYEESAQALQLVRQGIYKTSVLYSRLSEFYYHRALRNAALVAFYNRDFIRCIRHCKRALEVMPTDPVCRNYLAHAYHHVGQYGAAIKQLSTLSEVADGRKDVHFNLAKILVKADRMDEAIDILSALIDENARYADFHLIRGIAYARMGDSETAIRNYRESLRHNQTFTKAILLLGLEQVRITDYRAAFDTFRHGILIAPEDTDLLFYYGMTGNIISRLGESSGGDAVGGPDGQDEAIIQDISYLDHRVVEERHVLLDLDISYGEHFTFLDPIYDKPCLSNLVQVFESLTDTFPRYADYYYKLGTFYLKLGDVGSAERVFLRALDINPGYHDALNDLASVYESEGRLDEALGMVETVLSNRPEAAEQHLARGRILLKLGKLVDAAAAMRRAMELDERYNYHLYLLGHILRDEGMPEEAASCWRQVEQYIPVAEKDIRSVERRTR